MSTRAIIGYRTPDGGWSGWALVDWIAEDDATDAERAS